MCAAARGRGVLATLLVVVSIGIKPITIVLLPFIAWYLGISPWQALVMDAGFAVFYVVYALAFNWAYDRLFPLPEWGGEAAAR